MRRLLVDPQALREGALVVTGSQAHYLRDVLRLAPGDAVSLFDGQGYEAWARVVAVDRDGVRLAASAPAPSRALPALHLALVVALAKGERMDWVVEKATELGVAAILPAAAERSVVALSGERARARVARWQRVAEAAARQSGRADVPEIRAPAPWGNQIAAAPGVKRICFHTEAAPGEGREALAGPAPRSAAVAIGPEGGLVPAEVAMAREAGYSILSLGPRALRAETAAIVAVALVQHVWGDVG
jgi:16S rRNA (uracil1498-N3)-methyltransferase